MCAAAFVPERGEIWYSDGNSGFYAMKVTNGVWPFPRPTAVLGQTVKGAMGVVGAAPPAERPATDDRTKSLASTVPSVLVTWGAYAIYLASVAAIGSHAAANAVTAPRWILAIVVMVPLLTLLSVNLGILISTRVNDVRVAQQIGGLVVVPVVGLGIAQVTGRVVLDNGAFVQMTVVLVIIDILVFAFARLSFQRENILVRWR